MKTFKQYLSEGKTLIKLKLKRNQVSFYGEHEKPTLFFYLPKTDDLLKKFSKFKEFSVEALLTLIFYYLNKKNDKEIINNVLKSLSPSVKNNTATKSLYNDLYAYFTLNNSYDETKIKKIISDN